MKRNRAYLALLSVLVCSQAGFTSPEKCKPAAAKPAFFELCSAGTKNELQQQYDEANSTFKQAQADLKQYLEQKSNALSEQERKWAAASILAIINFHGREIMRSDIDPLPKDILAAERRLTLQQEHMTQITPLQEKLLTLDARYASGGTVVVAKTRAVVDRTIAAVKALKDKRPVAGLP